MKIARSLVMLLGASALVAGALGVSTAAQARDVAWSVDIASPGVQLGVSNAPGAFYRAPVYVQSPVVVSPAPIYYSQPQVIYSQPQVIYSQPIYSQPYVSYAQPQVVYAPQPYYVRSGWAAPPVYYRGWAPNYHRRHHDRDWRN